MRTAVLGSSSPLCLLKQHVELGHQEIDIVFLFGFERFGDHPRRVLVLLPSERGAVHLQDHVTHFQLAAAVRRPAPLWKETETRVKAVSVR